MDNKSIKEIYDPNYPTIVPKIKEHNKNDYVKDEKGIPKWWYEYLKYMEECGEETSNLNYDPYIHCCIRWYKDYCDCGKVRRDGIVKETEDFLNEENVSYTYSNVPNIVKVDMGKNYMYVSLKGNKKSLKTKYMGEKKWKTITKVKFLRDYRKNEN